MILTYTVELDDEVGSTNDTETTVANAIASFEFELGEEGIVIVGESDWSLEE